MLTIHKAAYKVLEELGKPLTYKEIWENIKANNWYPYADGVDEPNITRNAIERKCINSTRTGYPKKEVLFYRNDEDKYYLFESLSDEEKEEYSLEKEDEVRFLRQELNKVKLELEKLNTFKYNSQDIEEKLIRFQDSYHQNKKDNDIKTEDVSKFEDIIFSKISPNMKTIPTSPDVISLVEKVAKIIKK